MGAKVKCLEYLASQGLNTHSFETFFAINKEDCLEAFKSYHARNRRFSVRTDTLADVAAEHRYELPFIVIDDDLDSRISDIESFIEKSISKNLILIFSNGRQYEDDLIANIVVSIEGENIFIEMCSAKVALRDMYKNPSRICSLSGTIFNKPCEMKSFGAERYISDDELEEILSCVMSHYSGKKSYFELSLYSKNVGNLESRLVFWQVG